MNFKKIVFVFIDFKDLYIIVKFEIFFLQYQKERFTQEIEQLQKQVEYLNGELEKKIRDQQNILKDKVFKTFWLT